MRWITVVVTALMLAACSKPAGRMADKSADAAITAAPAAAPAAGQQAKPVQLNVPQLAYDYTYGIEASAGRIRALIDKHTAACAAAGLQVCQLTGSNLDASAKDQLHATLTLRATPGWLTGFRATLMSDAATDGARLRRAGVTSEDLSRQIVDTGAAIKAKTELRDRLLAVLASRPAKTSDLVDTEKALAEVQGDIDTANSEMAMMRERVVTSAVTVDYQTTDAPGAPTTWSPLRTALHDFLGTIVGGFGDDNRRGGDDTLAAGDRTGRLALPSLPPATAETASAAPPKATGRRLRCYYERHKFRHGRGRQPVERRWLHRSSGGGARRWVSKHRGT